MTRCDTPSRLLAAAALLLCARQVFGLDTAWGNVRDAGAYTAVNFEIANTDAGTEYTSAVLQSSRTLMDRLLTMNADRYGAMAEMVAGSSDGNANFVVNLQEDSWNYAIDTGNGSIGVENGGGRNAFSFVFGSVFYGTLFVNSSLLQGRPLGLAANAGGVEDRGYEMSACYITTPSSIPTVLGALRASGLRAGPDGSAELAVGASGGEAGLGRTFRVARCADLASGLWETNGLYAVTGAVTRVSVTGAVGRAFFKVVE